VIARLAGRDLATMLRSGILALAGLGIAGLAIELVFLRHWGSALETVVWPTMALLAIGWLTVIRARRPGAIRAARILAAIVLVLAGAGVAVHAWANFEAGPLDRDYAATWATLSVVQRWFLAVTGGVGPAPTLAPGALGEVALALLLGTVAHPALDGAAVRSPEFA
jgi:hypothetical protein